MGGVERGFRTTEARRTPVMLGPRGSAGGFALVPALSSCPLSEGKLGIRVLQTLKIFAGMQRLHAFSERNRQWIQSRISVDSNPRHVARLGSPNQTVLSDHI